MTSDSQTKLINKFEEQTKELAKNTPEWINEIRSQAMTRVSEVGIPTQKDEDWKYTNISPIAENSYSIATNGKLNESNELERYLSQDEINIVFLNGRHSDELSNDHELPKGIEIISLKEALETHEADIKKHLEKYDTKEETAFQALNKALIQQGVFIRTEKNVVVDKQIHIVHVTSENSSCIVVAPRTIIECAKSSEISVLESHISFTDEITYLATPLTDIHLEENATLHYCKAQKESLKAYHIGNTRVWQERNSNFDGFSLMTGSSITRNNLDIVLNGEGISSTLNGLYSLYGSQLADNHTSVDHRFPNCTSNQLYKGILNHSSRTVFNGKIFVQPIAQLTNSYQLNKNLQIGDDCRVDTKPQLEIFADDVKCTHGATIGQLEEDEIFYLQSRCIPKREAMKILSKGFVDDLLNTIESESLNKKLHILLEPSFAQF